MFNINWLAWFLPYIDVELFPFWLDWLLRDSERYFFSQHKDESPNLPCGFLWLPKVSYGRATCRVHFPFLASRRVKAEAENVHKVYDTIANHWNHTSLLQTPCFFLGGGWGEGLKIDQWSMWPWQLPYQPWVVYVSMILPKVGVVGWSRYYGIYGMWIGETDWTLLDFGRVRDQRLDFHVFEAWLAESVTLNCILQ